MYNDKLRVKFCSATNVLTVESNQTIKFEEPIKLGAWYQICDLKDEVLFEVQFAKVGEDSYELNVEGLDPDDQPDDYDIYDILNNQQIELIDEQGNVLGATKNI